MGEERSPTSGLATRGRRGCVPMGRLGNEPHGRGGRGLDLRHVGLELPGGARGFVGHQDLGYRDEVLAGDSELGGHWHLGVLKTTREDGVTGGGKGDVSEAVRGAKWRTLFWAETATSPPMR